MKSLFISALIMFSICVSIIGCGTSENLSGQWKGKMIQIEGPRGTDGYKMTFNLIQKDSLVNGTSRIEIPDSPYFAEMKVEGLIRADTLYFTETDYIKQNPRPEYFWCLEKGALKFDKKNKLLDGKWDSRDCAPGDIHLTKVN